MRGIKICGQIRGFVLKIDGEEIITDPSEKIQSVLSSKKLQCETCANLINIWKRKTVSTKSIRVHLLISRGFLQLNGPLMGFVLIATTRAVNNGYNTRGDQWVAKSILTRRLSFTKPRSAITFSFDSLIPPPLFSPLSAVLPFVIPPLERSSFRSLSKVHPLFRDRGLPPLINPRRNLSTTTRRVARVSCAFRVTACLNCSTCLTRPCRSRTC